MLSGGKQNRSWMVLGLFAVVALALLPVCPYFSPEEQNSGCHQDSAPEMPDMPAQHQQPCCWAGTHYQPGIPSAGPVISLVARGAFSEAGAPPAPQPLMIFELVSQGSGFSPPLKTVLRL
jgi:hypothetical protein